MPLDFRTTNTLWASVLAETLARLGLTTAVICPGSRSTPLAIAFAQHPTIDAIPILDERSASFFALGIAKRTHRPVVLVCTSGTAGANFYPAVIEARESRVSLMVLTADRPPELRHCNAGQAIDQQKLFGSYPNFYAEVALPSADGSMLAYWRQTIAQAWQRSHYPIAGVVHLNVPFREPLSPIEPEKGTTRTVEVAADPVPRDFFDHLQSGTTLVHPTPALTAEWSTPLQAQRGIIIAGVAQPENPTHYCRAIAWLSKTLNMPVLAEGLSPVRNYASLNPYLISTYDAILRNADLAEKLAPEVVIRIGDMPTSKELRQWLIQHQPHHYVLDPSDRNLDPLHGKTIHLPLSIESWATESWAVPDPLPLHKSGYLDLWLTAESKTRCAIDQTLACEEALFEGKAAWLLSQYLPEKTPVFISNSMPVRDVESFWKPSDRAIQPFFNRGANGIDGTLSTALGIAHHQHAVLLTGDLALLHDTNGFLLKLAHGHLTIVLINNNGGGIFNMLPISQFEPPFEEFFATPQHINFASLCHTYGVHYERISTWEQFTQSFDLLPTGGIRVLELKTDRYYDTQWRKNKLGTFATF
ncbi:2-succinyl-5-enolpyruvyl-6-hydroxy-3-cyclohexene-1-carboxylic-acid synthase [Myxacorys almedinensis]|uniref:2-succinyl-5-enolpyruvyl-6-hydroxy-3-cyclohexene-1-carboxylate synthase n=1 Tax=Myxacorys almedinensis A TaxID=2690445 RepID=A0A8J8CHN8_9CYAN|nr:2-succinyl-5-enolpyruvyl-6-hydroxy-3-cyclohexene-1-carboxylic-acid synthase [Myxacorys almedinensis]NDJ16864.1 2-succinyl-5-enolpyruvyl-6-hydroxy-3-cyclohexene-1-carboxylic-acid synthase [Myxacorys almedinensis A]